MQNYGGGKKITNRKVVTNKPKIKINNNPDIRNAGLTPDQISERNKFKPSKSTKAKPKGINKKLNPRFGR